MNVTLVEINVKPDRIDDFIEVFRKNHLGSIAEEGNFRFDVLQDPEEPTKFIIYESYYDDEAVKLHKTTPHYLACVDALEDIMTGPRSKRVFKGIMPELK